MEDYPILDLSHLIPSAQRLAQLPSDERIMHIRADRPLRQNSCRLKF